MLTTPFTLRTTGRPRPKRHLKKNYCSFVSVPIPIPPLLYRFDAGQTDRLVETVETLPAWWLNTMQTNGCIVATMQPDIAGSLTFLLFIILADI